MAKAEKKVKEAKIAALPPVEDVPKKRGRKPKAEIVSHETIGVTPEQVQEAAEEISKMIDGEIIKDLIALGNENVPQEVVSMSILSNRTKGTVEITNIVTKPIEETPKELSKQAAGWRDWLKYQRMTPDDFLKRYPTHKMIHFIKEIIEFNAQK